MVPRGMYSASPGRRTTSMCGSPSCDAGSCVWSFFPCAETGSCPAQPDDRVATGSASASYVFALGAHAVHQQRIRDGWFRPEPEACPARERDDQPTLVVIVRREGLGDPAGCEVQLGGGRPRQRRAEIVRERRDVRQPVDQATEHPGRADPQALLYIRSADEGVLAPVRGRTVEATCSTSTTRETRAGWLRPSHSGCVRTLVGGGGAVVPLLARHPVHEPSAPAVLLL